MDRISMTK
uniref:Cyclic nucleotide-gated ion channel-like protein n=1 Tax=Rhizophora mucronata TaxID=61149 RepID=A0A2P2JGD3_RHIMU